MMKPTFLQYDKPLLTAMIQYPTPAEIILKIKASLADGADAIGVQLCRLKKEYRTREVLTEIFDACEGRPIYVTNYPEGESENDTDEQCAELLLLALDCGATLLDIYGDMFDHSPKYQLAEKPEAIEKQKQLIDEIHSRGGEVLMSSHTNKGPLTSTTVEENLMIARTHEERGADVIKIVNSSTDINQIAMYVDAIQQIVKTTTKKLLFLVSGPCQMIRYLSPSLGACMYLCVQHQGPLDTKEQPQLSRLKVLRELMPFVEDV